MTGSHEVRGSIPLGSTNTCNTLGPPIEWPFTVLRAYGVPASPFAWDGSCDDKNQYGPANTGGTHSEVPFRRRRCSLSLIISLMSATGRISIVPHFMPGCCDIS